MDTSFKISVIIPVYNVQDYLEECLTSVADQTIGFDCLQLILVNDGSTDGSASVCERFSAEHPGNVIYVEQPNSGVAAARNRGLELASGELVTFLDGDDKWSSDSFEIAYDAYSAHPDISTFSCRMVFFDGETGEHQLNYKYAEDRIIDITEDYNFPQLSSSSVFIKAGTAKKYAFTEGLKYSEDFRFINEVLLDKNIMMLLRDPVYWYRRRPSSDSAIQRSVSDPDYYIPTCRNVYERLFNASVTRYGQVLKYLQFCVMYDLRWRLKIPLAESALDESSAEEYAGLLRKLLLEIEDSVILEQQRIALALKIYAIEFKHGHPVHDRISIDASGSIRIDDYPVFDLSRQPVIRIDSLHLDNDGVDISGQINLPFDDERFGISYILNGKKTELVSISSDDNIKTYLFGILKTNRAYSITEHIDYNDLNELSFSVSFDGSSFITLPEYIFFEPLNRRDAEYVSGRLTAYRSGSSLFISKKTLINSLSRKIRRKLSRI